MNDEEIILEGEDTYESGEQFESYEQESSDEVSETSDLVPTISYLALDPDSGPINVVVGNFDFVVVLLSLIAFIVLCRGLIND